MSIKHIKKNIEQLYMVLFQLEKIKQRGCVSCPFKPPNGQFLLLIFLPLWCELVHIVNLKFEFKKINIES